MNIGSHTPAQLVKQLPDLDAKYKKAEEHVQEAQQALHEARVAALAAKRELVSALSQLVKRYPADIVQEALEERSYTTRPVNQDNGDNGSAINTPDLLVAEQS